MQILHVNGLISIKPLHHNKLDKLQTELANCHTQDLTFLRLVMMTRPSYLVKWQAHRTATQVVSILGLPSYQAGDGEGEK